MEISDDETLDEDDSIHENVEIQRVIIAIKEKQIYACLTKCVMSLQTGQKISSSKDP